MQIKFIGSEDPEMQKCFTAGKRYNANDETWPPGFISVFDDNGDEWAIKKNDDDFAFE